MSFQMKMMKENLLGDTKKKNMYSKCTELSAEER